jgi:hypothetical protein
MSLELVNTLASLVTATVIGATAIAAIVQLRHMRMGNQITALLSLQNEFDSKDFRDAEDVIRKQLGDLHEDPEFCGFCISIARRETPPTSHPYEAVRTAAILVGNTFENLGVLVKNSIVERTLFLDVYSWNVASTWERLEPLVALTRAASGERSIWDNFEYIASISRTYLETHPDTYPPGVKRIDPPLSKTAAQLMQTVYRPPSPEKSEA